MKSNRASLSGMDRAIVDKLNARLKKAVTKVPAQKQEAELQRFCEKLEAGHGKPEGLHVVR